jgi:hypothetical protein
MSTSTGAPERPRLSRRVANVVRRSMHGVSYRTQPRLKGAISQACTYEQLRSPEYESWCDRLHVARLVHRKLWEWCYALQVLEDAGMLRPGRRGLGFGVGTEPITALLASRGCEVVATDLHAQADEAESWRATGQHADRLADLNHDELCDPEVFARAVSFRPVDMNDVPPDLTGFDFTWSSCAMEHLGSLDAGLGFLERQLECLRPGGVGVHTTEFNVSSDNATIEEGHTVLYRRADLEQLVYRMRKQGHKMRITFALGDTPEDLHVDAEPFTNTHIRTATGDFVHTSFGLVIAKR